MEHFYEKTRLFQKTTFKLLVFLLPTQLALHFWPSWAHVYGIRVDYLSPTVYLTDALVGLLLLLWVPRIKFFQNKTHLVVGLIGFSIFIFINVSFAENPQVATIKWIKIIEVFLVAMYVVYEKKLDFSDWIVKPLTYSIFLFSLIAMAQFALQKNVGGLLYFLGERSFSVASPGIALFGLGGRALLRPYSTFSHPNSFAGFLAVASVLILASKGGNTKLVPYALALSGIALILSASLGAWLAIAFTVPFYFILMKRKKMIRAAIFSLIGLVVIGSILLPVVSKESDVKIKKLPENIYERLLLSEASLSMFSDQPVFGVGLNNFVTKLPKKSGDPRVSWNLQPVHNIFLLVLAETGTAGFILFLYLIFKSLSNSLVRKSVLQTNLVIVLLIILLTGAVDHYWLTLQQNQLLVALVLGLSFRKEMTKR